MRAWVQLLSSKEAPYEFGLDTQAGAELPARPPFPDLEVASVQEVSIERFAYQVLRVRASRPEDGSARSFVIGRMVAVLAGGGEVEVQRDVAPEEEVTGEPYGSTCAACGQEIQPGDAVIITNPVDKSAAVYHRRCVDG